MVQCSSRTLKRKEQYTTLRAERMEGGQDATVANHVLIISLSSHQSFLTELSNASVDHVGSNTQQLQKGLVEHYSVTTDISKRNKKIIMTLYKP